MEFFSRFYLVIVKSPVSSEVSVFMQVKVTELLSPCITVTVWGQEKHERLIALSGHQINLHAIKEISLSELVAPENLPPGKAWSVECDVIERFHWKAIDHLGRVVIQLLPGFAQQAEEGLERVSVAIPATIETTFSQHNRNIPSA